MGGLWHNRLALGWCRVLAPGARVVLSKFSSLRFTRNFFGLFNLFFHRNWWRVARGAETWRVVVMRLLVLLSLLVLKYTTTRVIILFRSVIVRRGWLVTELLSLLLRLNYFGWKKSGLVLIDLVWQRWELAIFFVAAIVWFFYVFLRHII